MKNQCTWRTGGCVAWVALALGCGSNAVNVGDRPEPIGADDTPPDAGGSLVDGNPRCNIPNLGQYRILFDSDGGRLERRIYSMRADGTEIEPLTPPDELAREPALSPDGKQLAYSTPEGIVLRDMASAQSELLVPGGDQPQWSPDGTRLIYHNPVMGCLEQMTMPDRVVDPDLITCNVGMSSLDLAPNGSFVFVITTVFTGVDFGYQLVSDDVPWGTVPATTVEITAPTVSPDGVWVAASYRCGGEEPSLWASPLSVATPACEGRRITRAGAPSATNADWGPSTLIAYERGEPPRDIAIIAADTGEECVIAGPGDDRNPSWGIVPAAVPE